MQMDGRVGYWGCSLTVSFDDDMLAWLSEGLRAPGEPMGTIFAGFVDLSVVDHSVVIRRHADSPRRCQVHRGSPNDALPYRACTYFAHELDRPRFMMHEVRFVCSGDLAKAFLDEDHRLPWPKLQHANQTCPTLIMQDLHRRLVSAMRAGEQPLSRFRPPERYERLLDRDYWHRAVAAATAAMKVAA